ncbi:purine nucleosidase [Microbacterium sp. W4I4]|uniref:nucleoside hydrolase n=1 Tax=Microbacterium sp. W4I4 TaxID=3042295 RepID=UPI002788C5E2|nr:nucleoside hydrolase [Microbacterium sp. W4I4]MDQ0614061.1 purine nucleosidase [Microbacterium sp. W4I4]
MVTKLIIDCDPGVDDTMALMYAALHPDIELLAVGTVWGNVDVVTGTRNALHTLQMVGAADVPVAQGAAGPMVGAEPEFAGYVHGEDGQGNAYDGAPVYDVAPIGAAQQIVEIARRHPGEVRLVAVGPLTNLAAALVLEPDLPSLVDGVSIMGGAALAPGNATSVAEANIWHDAEAAAAVFRAKWDIIMVGLDVTMKVLITPERRAVLDNGGSAGRYLSTIMQFYGDFCAATAFGTWNATMHDTLAVAAAAGTLIVREAPVVNVEVDYSGGPSHGSTLCDLRGRYMGFPSQEGAHCTVLLDIDDSIADDVVAIISEYRGAAEKRSRAQAGHSD